MTENLNPFAIAQAQLDEAAAVLQLDPDMHRFLRQPMREFHFTIPVKMNDGRTEIFKGFRVQYNDARGDVYKRQTQRSSCPQVKRQPRRIW